MITPRDFLATVVLPNIAEFHANYGSLRHAYNAVAALDALAAHLFAWCKTNRPAEIAGIADDTVYRERLAGRDGSFALLRDIAKANKHVELTRGKPKVTRAEQVRARSTGWGVGKWGAARWGGPPQVTVVTNSGELQYLETLVDGALAFLESEMARLGA